jgi:hypothetical protein
MRVSMHRDHKIFIQAIKDRKKVLIKHRNDAGRDIRTKVYRPLFYIPDSNQNGCDHYYLWDGESNERGNIFWVTPAQIVSIELTQESFDPAGFVLASSEGIPPENAQSSGL